MAAVLDIAFQDYMIKTQLYGQYAVVTPRIAMTMPLLKIVKSVPTQDLSPKGLHVITVLPGYQTA